MSTHKSNLPAHMRGLITQNAEGGILREVQALASDLGAFRQSQDSALAAMRGEVRGLNDRLVQAENALARPSRGGGGFIPQDASAREALRQALRSACQPGGSMRELQALSNSSDPGGGYMVVPYLSPTIMNRVRNTSPIRMVARVINLTTGDAFEEVGEDGETAATWVSETEDRPETTPPSFRKLRIAVEHIYCAPAVTQSLLDDAENLDAWLAGAIARRFARSEGAAFVSGHGVKKPRGFATFPTTTDADAVRAWGTFQHVVTGASGAFNASNPADALMEVVELLHPEFRANAVWTMNRTTYSVIRKMKTSGGAYLLDFFGTGFAPPSNVPPAPDVATVPAETAISADATRGLRAPMLLGHPVLLVEDMPAIAANSLSVAFGDFSRGYTVVDRIGLRLLPDPYTSRPNVIMHAWNRVGGGVSDFDAIKFIKFST